mmetsp:Transcript_118191/g.341697  ORF Transcript_118191/g.341697 Transcript_118191/m.341697 type:complete len:80 (-) Transcript_118191:346-585(-)
MFGGLVQVQYLLQEFVQLVSMDLPLAALEEAFHGHAAGSLSQPESRVCSTQSYQKDGPTIFHVAAKGAEQSTKELGSSH